MPITAAYATCASAKAPRSATSVLVRITLLRKQVCKFLLPRQQNGRKNCRQIFVWNFGLTFSARPHETNKDTTQTANGGTIIAAAAIPRARKRRRLVVLGDAVVEENWRVEIDERRCSARVRSCLGGARQRAMPVGRRRILV